MMRAVLMMLGRLAYRAGLANIIIRLRATQVRVLLYHAVEDEPNDYNGGLRLSVSRHTFAHQLAYFKKHYRLIGVDDIGSSPETPSLCITFDDGFSSVYTNALPLLRQHDAPAVVYLVSCAVMQQLTWFNSLNWALHRHPDVARQILQTLTDEPLPETVRDCVIMVQETFKPHTIETLLSELKARIHFEQSHGLYLSKGQVREMQQCSVRFGFHTRDHYNLLQCDQDTLVQQLDCDSVRGLLDSDSIAYPCGYYDESIMNTVQKTGYSPVMTVGYGNSRISELHVDRTEIFDDEHDRIFAHLEVAEPVLSVLRRFTSHTPGRHTDQAA